MPEHLPILLGQNRGIAFIEGPLVEAAGEFLGRLNPLGRGLDAILRVLPLPALQAALKKQKERTKQQDAQDGTNVLKVRDAIKIVEDELTGFVGGINEIGDFVSPFLPQPGGSGAISLVDRISERIREKALQKGNSRVIGVWEPNKPDATIEGTSAAFSTKLKIKIRKGVLHGLNPPKGLTLPA